MKLSKCCQLVSNSNDYAAESLLGERNMLDANA